MNEIEFKISLLIDNELNDLEQSKLFEILSQNKNARGTFNEFINIKREAAICYSGSAANLDFAKQLKFTGNEKKNTSMYKVSFIFSVAAVLVLAALLVFNLISSKQLQAEKNSLITQNHVLLNKLSAKQANVSPALQKEAKIGKNKKKKVLAHKKDNVNRIDRRTISQAYYNSFQINKVIVTNEDFIGGKIVAN